MFGNLKIFNRRHPLVPLHNENNLSNIFYFFHKLDIFGSVRFRICGLVIFFRKLEFFFGFWGAGGEPPAQYDFEGAGSVPLDPLYIFIEMKNLVKFLLSELSYQYPGRGARGPRVPLGSFPLIILHHSCNHRKLAPRQGKKVSRGVPGVGYQFGWPDHALQNSGRSWYQIRPACQNSARSVRWEFSN